MDVGCRVGAGLGSGVFTVPLFDCDEKVGLDDGSEVGSLDGSDVGSGVGGCGVGICVGKLVGT